MALHIIAPDKKGEHPKDTISSTDPRLPASGFVYPDEIERLIESAEVRALLDEFVMSEMFKALAGTLNRILSGIIGAENPKKQAIVAAWSVGIRLPGLEEAADICIACGISRATLHRAKEEILRQIQA